jgi:predicted ester cyclase
MSTTNNEAKYRRLIEEGFNQGNLGIVDELVAPDALEHQRGIGGGRDGVKGTIKYLRGAFPDFKITIEEVISVGDKVWVRQRGGGTNLGPFNGHPPTGRNAFTDVMDVVRFQDGMMVEHWGVPDQLGMMQALGLIPSR